jgi:penicillin-binding protein 1A
VAVQIWQEVGADSVVALAQRVGIESPIAAYPSSALGASAVRPLDYVASYTVFANDGRAVEPRLIVRVDDRAGKTVAQGAAPAPRQALDASVAFIVRDMMRDVVERGTANSVRRFLAPGVPAAGKTGTTNDNSDVWFVGATPDLVGGVWLGFDAPKTIAAGAAGGSLAAPIWGRVMAAWYGSRTAPDWTPPPGVVTAELDRLTGEPANDTTPAERRYTEYFLEGTEPGAARFNPWKLFQWGPIAQ